MDFPRQTMAHILPFSLIIQTCSTEFYPFAPFSLTISSSDEYFLFVLALYESLATNSARPDLDFELSRITRASHTSRSDVIRSFVLS